MFHGFQQTVQQIWDRKVSSDIWTRFLLPKSSWIRKFIRGSQNKQWHHLFSPDYMETLWSRHLDSVLNSLVRLSSFKIYNVIQNYHSFFRKWTNDKSLILMLVWCLDGFLLLKFGCWRWIHFLATLSWKIWLKLEINLNVSLMLWWFILCSNLDVKGKYIFLPPQKSQRFMLLGQRNRSGIINWTRIAVWPKVYIFTFQNLVYSSD